MKERPILFSAPMVMAILSGTKSQTRRVIKPQPRSDQIMPANWSDVMRYNPSAIYGNGLCWTALDTDGNPNEFLCPYGQPGDRLFVREEFSGPHYQSKSPPREWSDSDPIWYWADGNPESGDWTKPKPSIHMPRWASRILLEVTGVRVERLNDISDVDSLSEGITSVRSNEFDVEHFKDWKERFDTAVASGEKPPVGPSPKESFKALWESINGPVSWKENPFVWVIDFKRIDNA